MGNVYMEASQIIYRGGEKKMSVEEALKNTSGEAAAIAQLQQDVSDLNDVKANKITIAPAFSAETSYDPGDLVYYNGLTYRCVNAHSGEWDADDFAATTIDNELSELRSGLIGRAALSAVTENGDSFEVVNPNQNGSFYTYGIVVGGFSARFAAYIIRCGVNTDEIVATPLTTDAGTMTFTRSGSTITIACSTTFYGGVRVVWLG